MASPKLKIGDLVEVLWGLDIMRGKLIDIYGPPGRLSALVEVYVVGSDNEILESTSVSLPLASLSRAEPAEA